MHYTICDFTLDIIQNSLEAGADMIDVDLRSGSMDYSVCVADNGCGMTGDEAARLKDPYVTDGKKHEKRTIGLGIPFLVQAVEQCGGTFSVESEPGRGTTVRFCFPAGHFDTPPFGDVPGLVLQAFIFDSEYELIVNREVEAESGTNTYRICRSECREALGDIYIGASLKLLRRYLQSQEEYIYLPSAANS